jgi:hypothetical protein
MALLHLAILALRIYERDFQKVHFRALLQKKIDPKKFFKFDQMCRKKKTIFAATK